MIIEPISSRERKSINMQCNTFLSFSFLGRRKLAIKWNELSKTYFEQYLKRAPQNLRAHFHLSLRT